MVVGTDSATAMRKNLALRNLPPYSNIDAVSYPSESFHCENWTVAQTVEWVQGIDECVAPYVKNFEEYGVDGAKLLHFDEDALRRIGVARENARTKISNAIGLLCYYTDTVKQDNLQKAAMQVNVSVGNMLNAIALATPVINNPLQTARVFDVLNSVLRAVADVYNNVRRLMCWLDRSPFDDKKEFISLREKISAFIKEMIDCVNNPNNPKFFSVPQLLVERGKRIQEVCLKIVRMNDPSILYTAFLERVTIRKTSSSRWGFDVNCTYTGVGMVTRVILETPAGISGKIEAGDEILEVNGTAVVGWSQASLIQKISASAEATTSSRGGHAELMLLLSKRPREFWAMNAHGGNLTPSTPLTPSRPKPLFESAAESADRTKMMLDFKLKIQPDLFARNECNPPISTRGRSLSFSLSPTSWAEPCERCTVPAGRCVSLFVASDKRQQVSRRASVWSESPPAMLRSPFDRLHYQMESNAWLLLLANWGNGRQKYGGRNGGPLTPRLKDANGVIKEEEFEDSSSDDAKKFIAEIEFAQVESISDSEFDRLRAHFRLHVPSVHDHDWNGPIREITGIKFATKRTHLESGSNTSVIDSPFSTIQAKITRFFYGDPSPSHSVASGGGGAHFANASTALPDSISTSVSSEKLVVDGGGGCRTPLTTKLEHHLFGGSAGGSSVISSPLPSTPSATSTEKFTLHALPRRSVAASSVLVNSPTTPAEKISAHHSPGNLSQHQSQSTTSSNPPPMATPLYHQSMTPTTTVTNLSTSVISGSGGVGSSFVGEDCVSSADLPQIAIIKTVARNSQRSKLAPLAEPDDVGELSGNTTVVTETSTDVNENDATARWSLHDLALIPCRELQEKTYEGAVRRQKLLLLDSGTVFLGRNERGSQWIKCWMVLKENILYIYSNEMALEADVVINVSYFYLTTSTDLKTTKKQPAIRISLETIEKFADCFVFALCWNLEMVNFALYSNEELKRWLKYLQPIARKSSGSSLSPAPIAARLTDDEFDLNENEKSNAIFVRASSSAADDCASSSCGEGGGTASGSTGPPTPSPLCKKSMPIPPPLSMPISCSSQSGIAVTTPLPSPRSSNFTFLPSKILSKVQRHSSLRSPNSAGGNSHGKTSAKPESIGGAVIQSSNVMTTSTSSMGFCPASSTLNASVPSGGNTFKGGSLAAQADGDDNVSIASSSVFFSEGCGSRGAPRTDLITSPAERGGAITSPPPAVSISISGSSPPMLHHHKHHHGSVTKADAEFHGGEEDEKME